MPMNCPSCGRALATGAKCIYCAQGTQVKRKEQLVVPKGSTKPPKKSFGIPWKTILVRTVADGGESFYVQGDHRLTVQHLRRAVLASTSAEEPMQPGARIQPVRWSSSSSSPASPPS